MAEWLVRETQNLLIAVGRISNPRHSLIFANSSLISVFSYCTFKSCFFLSWAR